MTTLIRSVIGRSPARSSHPSLGWDQFLSYFTFGGNLYPLLGFTQTLVGGQEDLDHSFAGYVHGAYRSNGIVFACELARVSLFSEARFQFQRLRDGRPGELFGTGDLAILEKPWPTGVTGDLMARLMLNADLGGTGFARLGEVLHLARPRVPRG